MTTSLSSHRDAISTSEEPAVPRCIRPGIKPPAPGRFFCRPDLLERCPAVCRALPAHEPRSVGPLEPEVHLETAVVAVAGVRAPAALEAMDAEPPSQVRRARCLSASRRSPSSPERDGALDVRDAHLREHPAFRRCPRNSHQSLPAPRGALVAVHLVSEPFDRRPVLGFDSALPCRNGLCGAGPSRATTTREQAGAGQDESPQKTPPPTVDRLPVVGRAGCARRGRHRSARLCRAYAHPRRDRHVKGL